MASGTPVVATGNVGAREVLRDGASGVIAEEDELGHVINELFGDDELRAKYREAGLMRAQDFSWDRVCAQYEALYHGGSEASPEPAIASPILSRR
jgi:glycosyltransferase involved in cell wall biosynthesis